MTIPEGFILDQPQEQQQNKEQGLPPGFVLNPMEKQAEQIQPKDDRSIVDKVVDKGQRLVSQGLIGGIQSASLPFDLAAIASKKIGEKGAPMIMRHEMAKEIEMMVTQKQFGDWTPEDEERLDFFKDLVKNPSKINQFLPKEEDIPDYDIGSLIEKGAEKLGVDLKPQGIDEMAMRWIGFIKNPVKAQDLVKNGLNKGNIKEVIKALAPTGKEAIRGAGAATALQYAADAEMGPLGTMAMLGIGDLGPGLAAGGVKSMAKLLSDPKKYLKELGGATKEQIAKSVVKIGVREKAALQKELIREFREAGIQADIGTITNNRVIGGMQNALSQSSLTGQALEDFRKSLTKDIVSEYGKIADSLGEAIHETKFEAGEALKGSLKEARDLDLNKARELYSTAKAEAGETQVFTGNVGAVIQDIEKELKPGTFKSAEQQAVLDVLREVKNDVMTPEGGIKSAAINELINNKIALNDVISYEVQGGAKQLLKRVVKELDKTITAHGKENPSFAKNWKRANAKFAKHAELFRGKTIANALKTQDSTQVFNKMNTANGIHEIRKALSSTPEGRQLFNQLARFKLEEQIGNNLVDSTSKQLKLGTFSKLLEKGNRKEVVKALLGESKLRQLERLQRVSGRLADSAQKFLNTSRSGVHAKDLAAAGKIMYDVANLVSGNPWPLMKTGGVLLGARQMAKLMADPEFLRLVEDVLLEQKSGSQASFINAGRRLAQKVRSIEKTTGGAVREVSREK